MIAEIFGKKPTRKDVVNLTFEPLDSIEEIRFSEEPWVSRDPLSTQLSPEPPFHGAGLLMRASTEQLREILRWQTSNWDDAQLIGDVIEYVQELEQNQKPRKDGRTPYENHLLRTAISAAQLFNNNAEMVAVALLHAGPEKRGITQEDVLTRFTDQDTNDLLHPEATLKRIYAGANALSNKNDGKPLTQRAYFSKIDAANAEDPNLHLWVIRGLDRFYNLTSDLSAVARHTTNQRAHTEHMLPYADRARSITPVIRKREPASSVLNQLTEATNLAADYAMKHGLEITTKKPFTIFSRRGK